jgi:hypothetical protein
MTFIPTEISHVQAGDQILVQSKVWTIKCLEGPDRIGTYDLYLQDERGSGGFAIANEFVTIVR